MYVEGEKCGSCVQGYELNEEQTKCTRCSGENTSIYGEKCHKKIDKCTSYDIDYDDDDNIKDVKCYYCETGYSLVQDRTKCTLTCADYNKVRPFSDCIAQITNCNIYNEDDTCKQCDNRYRLKSDNKECIQCSEGYTSNGIKCFLPHLYCDDEYDDSGNCISCDEGYKLSSGSCVKNGSGMNIYNSFNFKIISLLLIILF